MALTDKLTAIGDAIREKNGTTEKIPLADMPQAVLDIVSGGSVEYSDIVYNEDNSITLTEANGTVHTMECSYSEDGRLTSIKYDGKTVALTYEGDVLVKVGATDVDLDNAPTEMGALETLIDNSGVLDSTEGTATEKVEQLIEKANDENLWYEISKTSKYMGTSLFRDYKGTVLPRLNLEKTENMSYFLNSAPNIIRIDEYINSASCMHMAGAFNSTTNLKYMKGINTSVCSNITGLFQNSGIEEIEIPFDISKVTSCNNAFTCSYLIEIRFITETIKISIAFGSAVLSTESIQSIIDGLAIVETAQTLTLHKNIVLTDEQKATINAKGWTLAQ